MTDGRDGDWTRFRRVLAAVVLFFIPGTAHAQGGPPLMTDDPDTPGPGYWEINVATLFDRTSHEHTLETPRLDVNYGVGRRIQLKFEMPWVRFLNEAGRVETGAGTATAGVKWRMIGQEGATLAWSIYPQLSFRAAASSVEKGISEGGLQFLMPTEITAEIAHAEINVEVGRTFVSGGPDSGIFGVSTEGHVAPRLELLAELHGEQITGNQADLFLTGGARQKLTKTMILLFAAGRTIRSPAATGSRLYLYTGIQFNLPGQFALEQARPKRPRA